MKDGEWLDEMVNWLDSFPWQWFCTLTFRPGLSQLQARWRVRCWADELRDELGTVDFQLVGVPESGVTGLNFHYHVLVAGLRRGCGATELLQFMRRWWKLAGDARIEPYRAESGGVRYVLKHIGPNDFDKIEFHLATRTQAPTCETYATQPGKSNLKREK